MTCLNEVLSITLVEFDGLINKVTYPRDSRHFKNYTALLGGADAEGEEEEKEKKNDGYILKKTTVGNGNTRYFLQSLLFFVAG